MKSPQQQGSLIADHGSEPVVFSQRVGGSARARLLPQAKINSAHHLGLFVKDFQLLLHLAIEQHPAVQLDALFFAEIFRIADRRRRRVQIAANFVAYFSVFDHFDGFKIRTLQSPIRDAVRIARHWIFPARAIGLI